MKEQDQKRFEALLGWSQQHGAKIHAAVEIYDDDTTKFSLRVKPSATDVLKPGSSAVTCPVSTTLSYLNALIDGPLLSEGGFTADSPNTPAFPPQFMTTLPPHVIGRFFLIKEYLRGKTSFWYPYTATLPQPEHISSWSLPAFWPEDDIEFLEGTNAYVAIQEIQANVKSEYKQARKALKEADFEGWQDYTQMLYKWAFSIFTSRSFRPSLILSPANKEPISRLLPAGCELDDFSILQPLFDIGNHKMTAKYTWDVTSNPTCCQLICGDEYGPGEQVFNNYGLKSNSELLLGYGFILPETEHLHNDYVHVRKRQQQLPERDSSDKPKDFLISLRPISHPSSVAGLARLLAREDIRVNTLPGLSNFEPALIRDLASMVASPEEKVLFKHWLSSETEGIPAGLEEFLEKIRGTLGGKLQFDYQRLKSVQQDEETGEERIREATNRNQELALEYRRQYEKVLIAGLEALSE
ncbi:hypothetical protein QBC35DRAFT_220129 [Podospora australis]|uniref:SET domain-containing protein n=1 Tax=Podospora australis TaxID=1536484 RepID=A0AAN7AIF9_9PEZI|nr:hypothetical protein QBC35DRAFT_220129 [Podospora australis]